MIPPVYASGYNPYSWPIPSDPENVKSGDGDSSGLFPGFVIKADPPEKKFKDCPWGNPLYKRSPY